MRVAHVQLLSINSGVQNVTIQEIQQLSDVHKYSLICKEEGPLTETLKNIDIHYIPDLCRELSPNNDLRSFISFYKLFKEKNYDIVHTHSSKTGVLGRISAFLSGSTKTIHTVHGFSFPAAKSRISFVIYFLMEYFAKYFTTHLIVLNQNDFYIATQHLKYNKRKVSIISNGVNLSDYKATFDVERKFNKIEIVMVGRLWEQKDPLTLLRAINFLVKKGVDLSVTFIGDGPLFSNMETFIEQEQLQSRVKLHGWSDSVATILNQHNLFILPSLWEGMPLAILEAMACGLPIIATDIPGNRDLVEVGENGFTFESGNYLDLASCIENYIKNPNLLREHSITSRVIVEEKYDLQKRGEKISKLYTTVLS